MSNSLILFLWYLAGMFSSFSWYVIIRAFMSGGRNHTFDPFGTSWILLKSLLYGVVSLMLGTALLRYFQHTKDWCLILFFAVTLVILDRTPSRKRYATILDRLIAYGGYGISRLHPYAPIDAPISEGQKVVISSNHRLSAVTPLGPIELTAGNGNLRTIKWDGVTRKIALINNVRRSSIQGFDFRSGRVNPSGYIWKMHKGVSKCHYSEVIKDCENDMKAAFYVEDMQNETIPGVASSDGLIVGWSTECELDTLTVVVTQILINGEKPSNLVGADDSKISLASCK